MAKKAVVVFAEGFEDIEGITIVDVLRRAGVEVTMAGLNDLDVRGSRGTRIIADKKLDDVVKEDFDAVILPGGMPGATNLAASGKLKAFLVSMAQAGRIVAAICASPAVVLAPLGILKGRKATTYPGMQDRFAKDISYKEDDVVVDGNIITSRGPATAMPFAVTLVEKLVGKDAAAKLRKDLLMK